LLGGGGLVDGMVNLAVLTCLLRATTKKSHQLFDEKNATPENIPAMPMNDTVHEYTKYNSTRMSALFWILPS